MAEAGQRLDKQFALVGAQVAIGIHDAFQRARNIIGFQARPGNRADRGLLIGTAAKGDLIEFLTFLIDAQNADMADMMVATSVDTSGNIDVQAANILLIIRISEDLLDSLTNRNGPEMILTGAPY